MNLSLKERYHWWKMHHNPSYSAYVYGNLCRYIIMFRFTKYTKMHAKWNYYSVIKGLLYSAKPLKNYHSSWFEHNFPATAKTPYQEIHDLVPKFSLQESSQLSDNQLHDLYAQRFSNNFKQYLKEYQCASNYTEFLKTIWNAQQHDIKPNINQLNHLVTKVNQY